MIFISNLWTVWIRLQFPERQVLTMDSSFTLETKLKGTVDMWFIFRHMEVFS